MNRLDRVRLMVSGNLHVINVSSADQGQYSCTAANHITGELIDGQRVLKLVVKGAPVRTKAATITWQPQERYISQIGRLKSILRAENKFGFDFSIIFDCLFFGLASRPQRDVGMRRDGLA